MCLGFVVVAMFEFALVILFNRREAAKRSFQDDRNNKERKPAKKLRFKMKIQPTLRKANSENMEIKSIIVSAHVIDFVSFWIHFSAFLIFNIIYWNDNLELII